MLSLSANLMLQIGAGLGLKLWHNRYFPFGLGGIHHTGLFFLIRSRNTTAGEEVCNSRLVAQKGAK